jgi:hypothetical protein
VTKAAEIRERLEARRRQRRTVMDLIGPLLDAWEDIPNDIKSDLREHCTPLCHYLDRINEAMEN